MAVYERLQYIGSFDLRVIPVSLGDVVIPHGGAMYSTYKLDTTEGQIVLVLTFKTLPQSGSTIDAGAAFGGPQNRFNYLWGIYWRNVVQGLKPIIVNGPHDTVDRFYMFADSPPEFINKMSRMWELSSFKLRQWRLAGTTDITDPLSQPNPLTI